MAWDGSSKLCSWLMQVIEAQDGMAVDGVVALYSSLLTFTLQVHTERLDYVDQILVNISISYKTSTILQIFYAFLDFLFNPL